MKGRGNLPPAERRYEEARRALRRWSTSWRLADRIALLEGEIARLQRDAHASSRAAREAREAARKALGEVLDG